MSVIACQGIPPLKDALLNGQEENIKQTAAWALGQIGFHSNDNARAMAEGDNPAIAILLKVTKNQTVAYKFFIIVHIIFLLTKHKTLKKLQIALYLNTIYTNF